MPTNQAAWLPPKHARLSVGPAPYTRPEADEIVVENRAVAINPLDWILQEVGTIIYPWVKYPAIIGTDVAGVVVEVGSAVTRFAVGDRVLGMTVGTDKDSNSSARGAFQRYSVVFERLASPIPDDLPFENAAVLPLGISTAACALFEADQLALDYPTPRPASVDALPDESSARPSRPTATSAGPASKGTVLVWGASTSVGSNAVQLAVAAGYDVVATASPRNFDYVRSLGASQVFDYSSASVVGDIVAALRGTTFMGAAAIGAGSSERCSDIVRQVDGRKRIALLSTPVSFNNVVEPGRRKRLPLTFMRIGMSQAAYFAKAGVRGIRSKFVIGSSLKNTPVSTAIYADFLPQALAAKTFTVAPEPLVIGHGLDQVQAAFDANRRGVSARKAVVTL